MYYNSTEYAVIHNLGMKDCLFRCVSQYYHGCENDHLIIRQQLIHYLKKHCVKKVELLRATSIERFHESAEDYISCTGKSAKIGIEFEIAMISKIYEMPFQTRKWQIQACYYV